MPHLKVLLDGFQSFRDKYYKNSTLMQDVATKSATPDVFLIQDTDAAGAADILFDQAPCTLFGTRIMAALVPPYDPQEANSNLRACIAHAIDIMKVKDIIVLGHTGSGGIDALVKRSKNKEIMSWMHAAEPALAKAKAVTDEHDVDALCRETERQCIIMSMRNLMTYPSVQKAVKNGALRLHGWMFDMGRGVLLDYNLDTRYFEPLVGIDSDIGTMIDDALSAERDFAAVTAVN